MTKQAGASVATIVMYHVVRNAAGVPAALKGLDADAFRGQLAYIRAHYTPVGLFDLVAASTGSQPLPPRAIVLTFDDGYAGHHDVVLPLLADAHVPAAFFPVASASLDRAVLDINKVQFILAASGDAGRLVEIVDATIERHRPHLPAPAEYRKKWWMPSRWDPPEVVYVKRLLQHALPEDVRRGLVDQLFRTMVSADERGFADELYMNRNQLVELHQAGMTIGIHGDRHLRLAVLPRDEQAVEIDGALRLLDAVGLPRQRFAYSYANGDHNDDSIELLQARGCSIAVTTRPDLARVGRDRLLTLPRIDTNDLPVGADAEPNEWTRRAMTAGGALQQR
jgi:peptidoglycan/xylan/chitin deacetylase (PgdA/CDA1 family)